MDGRQYDGGYQPVGKGRRLQRKLLHHILLSKYPTNATTIPWCKSFSMVGVGVSGSKLAALPERISKCFYVTCVKNGLWLSSPMHYLLILDVSLIKYQDEYGRWEPSTEFADH